jgi:hypothetical protein
MPAATLLWRVSADRQTRFKPILHRGSTFCSAARSGLSFSRLRITTEVI